MLTRYIFLLCLTLLIGCESAEITPKEHPYLITMEPGEPGESSMVFHAKIISLGNSPVVEYGFIWDIDDPNLISSNKSIMSTQAEIADYSQEVDFGLIKDQMQLVRAYLITEDYTVLGNSVSFVSNGTVAPTILDFEPKAGYVDDKITISGKNFAGPNASIKVFLDDLEVEIESIDDNTLVFLTPDVDKDTKSKITIESNGTRIQSEEEFTAYTYWEKVSNFSGRPRYAAATFTIGDRAFVGTGALGGREYLNDFWEYIPESNTWIKRKDFPGGERGFAVGFSIGGKGYIGFGLGSFSNYYSDLWEYDPELDTWTEKPGNTTIRTYSDACFVLNDVLYLHTGGGFYSYNPATNTYTQLSRFATVPHRSFTVGLVHNNKGYIVAGHGSGNRLSKDLWEFNPTNTVWTEKAEIPEGYRGGPAAFVLNDKIYAGLGGSWGGSYSSFYEYDVTQNEWVSIQDFKGDQRELPVSFVIGDKAYVGLGRRTRSETLNDFWVYDPTKK